MRTTLSQAAIAALLLLTGTLAGCGPQVGAILYHSGLIPEDKTKEQFKLTQNRLVILIDDPTGALPNSELRGTIHNTLASELMAHKACGPIVAYNDVMKIERTSRDFDNMSIRAIGEQLQAEQVLHVSIQTFSTGKEAKLGVYQGQAQAFVKVCSTEKKPHVRLWPATGEGQFVEVTQPGEQSDQWGSKSVADSYSQAIAARLAKRIAMLFYEHPTEAERNLAVGRNEQPQR